MFDFYTVIAASNRSKKEHPPALGFCVGLPPTRADVTQGEGVCEKTIDLHHLNKQLLVSSYPGSLESEFSIKLVLYIASGLSEACETGYAQTVTGLAINPDISLFR